ncbi:MAG: hypothetical protein V7682_05115 [Cycloclasticus sp.]
MNNLPNKFEGLSKFVAEWALDTEQARFDKRTSGKVEEIKFFYDAIIQQMPDIMAYLKDKEVEPSEQEDKNLLNMAMSCVEVSRIFEVWNQLDVRSDYLDPKRMTCLGYEGAKKLDRVK